MTQDSVRNMRRRTVRLDREGDYWTDYEKQQLVSMFDNGDGITAMALQLQRTEPATVQMIEKLDLYNRKSQPSRRKSAPKPAVCLCDRCQLDPALCPYRHRCIRAVEEE